MFGIDRRLGPVAVLTLTLMHVGCAMRAAHDQTSAFAQAVSVTTSNVEAAFDAVEHEYANVQADRLVVNYDKTGFNPADVKDFLSPEDLQIRMKLLKGISEYATSLAEISSDKKLTEFDDATKQFGTSLQTLSSSAAGKLLPKASDADRNVATTAIDALGRWFIERKRQKELPKLVTQMQGPIKKICELLSVDIGNAPDSSGSGGSGLRDQLWREYSQRMMDESAFIDHSKGMDAMTRAAEIRKLPALVRQQRLADATLAETQAGLKKIAITHTQLVKALADRASFTSQASELASESRRIREFYTSLQNGSK